MAWCIICASAIALPFILNNPYLLHLVILVLINAALGIGFSLIYSTGLITLGASAFWGVGAYASALLVMRGGFSFWLALPVAAILSALVAMGIGFLIVRYVGAGFVVFTLLFCLLVQKIFGYVEVFGGWGGITEIPPPDPIRLPFWGGINFSTKVSCYYLILFLLIIMVIMLRRLYSSRIGRAWKATRFRPELAETLGINVNRYRLLAFSLSSAFAGLVGSFYAHYNTTISPLTFDILKSVHIQIYSILGGMEFYILGPLIGSAIFTFLPEFLRVSDAIEPYVTGLTLILLVLFLPQGIGGLRRRAPSASSHRLSDNPEAGAVSFAAGGNGFPKVSKAILEIRDLSKFFGGYTAISGLNLGVFDSEILAIIGPNGAGKSTLFNLISGFLKPTQGKIIFGERDITGMKPYQIAQIGIARTFQASTIFKELTVFDNVYTARHKHYRTHPIEAFLGTKPYYEEDKSAMKKALELLEFMGLAAQKSKIAGELSGGYQKALAICIAFATNPKLLLLDEPITTLSGDQIETVMNLVRKVRNAGTTVIIIEHNMKVVMDYCDRIVALAYGKKIAEGSASDIRENRDVIEAYLGARR